MPWFSPSGDLNGSAFDYAQFLEAWRDGGAYPGGRLLAEATVEEALGEPGLHWEIFSSPGEPPGEPADTTAAAADAGSGALLAFGHRGETGTLALAIPGRDAIVIYLTQSRETEVVDEVVEWALETFTRAGDGPSRARPDP